MFDRQTPEPAITTLSVVRRRKAHFLTNLPWFCLIFFVDAFMTTLEKTSIKQHGFVTQHKRNKIFDYLVQFHFAVTASPCFIDSDGDLRNKRSTNSRKIDKKEQEHHKWEEIPGGIIKCKYGEINQQNTQTLIKTCELFWKSRNNHEKQWQNSSTNQYIWFFYSICWLQT